MSAPAELPLERRPPQKLSPERHLSVNERRFVNEMRLNWREWLLVSSVLALALILTPILWKRVERFDTGPDYRIPYSLSKDYWLDSWRLQRLRPDQILVFGDSVVWGEYVRPDGALSHFLNQKSGRADRFVNGGVNGLFPLALDGLMRYYGGSWRGRAALLQCNLLWMTSPSADLSAQKEEAFNHADLVPQFRPRLPCYRASVAARLDIVVDREVPFLQWVHHLQNCYYDQKNILSWTMEEEENPERFPNVYRNPFAPIRLEVPQAPANDPERGPDSPRHQPWFKRGMRPQNFDWVTPAKSEQWPGFQNLTQLLRRRGKDVFVLVGPFNEHIISPESKAGYEQWRATVRQWLQKERIPFLEMPALPSELYADTSHPLTRGYELLAGRLLEDSRFQQWLQTAVAP